VNFLPARVVATWRVVGGSLGDLVDMDVLGEGRVSGHDSVRDLGRSGVDTLGLYKKGCVQVG
jgi:hypothetical protein